MVLLCRLSRVRLAISTAGSVADGKRNHLLQARIDFTAVQNRCAETPKGLSQLWPMRHGHHGGRQEAHRGLYHVQHRC